MTGESVSEAGSSRRTITISTLAALVGMCVVILPIFGTITYPWFKGIISEAVAADVKTQIRTEVSQQTAPFNAAMKVLLENQVIQLEDEIDTLKYRRDRPGAIWTEGDQRDLAGKIRRLSIHQAAL